jgi:hypothetical protein
MALICIFVSMVTQTSSYHHSPRQLTFDGQPFNRMQVDTRRRTQSQRDLCFVLRVSFCNLPEMGFSSPFLNPKGHSPISVYRRRPVNNSKCMVGEKLHLTQAPLLLANLAFQIVVDYEAKNHWGSIPDSDRRILIAARSQRTA